MIPFFIVCDNRFLFLIDLLLGILLLSAHDCLQSNNLFLGEVIMNEKPEYEIFRLFFENALLFSFFSNGLKPVKFTFSASRIIPQRI
jgi:hypothetical protein